MVSSDAPAYDVQLVQLMHGDTNPDGPGFKERAVPSSVDGNYPGEVQKTYAGSHVKIPDVGEHFFGPTFTVQAMVCPTRLASGRQAIVAKWAEAQGQGFGLYIGEDGSFEAVVGDGEKNAFTLTTGKSVVEGLWYLVAFTYDHGHMRLIQKPWMTHTNSRFSLATDLGPTTADVRDHSDVQPTLHNESPLMLASHTERHTDEAIGLVPGALFNGKIDSVRVYRRALSLEAIVQNIENPRSPDVVGVWDFENEITAGGVRPIRSVSDSSGNALHGVTVNMPTRGVTGYNWEAREQNFIHAPSQYGAIHFHEDDLDDARWATAFKFTVPLDTPSALYAMKLEADDDTEYVPFFVRPVPGQEKKIAFLAPTASYMAYANDNVSLEAPLAQLMVGRVPVLDEGNITLSKHRELGLSTYDHHTDGSGVSYSTRLRPILNMRPGFRHWLSPSLWQFNADLHLIDWLIEMGYEFDVITDEDLHREGRSVIDPYNVVVTGSHPEYYTEPMLDALHEYADAGGRLMYMASNGFYWVTAYDGDDCEVIEVRKGHGNNAWKSKPGQFHLALTGEYGTLWEHRGRAPHRLFGVGFGSEGFDVSEPYHRTPDSYHDEMGWMFEGIDDDVLGDFGLVGGGAAGLELDIYDPSRGSPPETRVVATSANHTHAYQEVVERLYFNAPGTGGGESVNVRADIVYCPASNGGATWSVSSIAYCGSLSHNGYDNNISRLTANVLSTFAKDEWAPLTQ